ncbi:autotransporter outer membrane beta-barrel domain-containing protein [Martelella mediterranea]|uniref:autotransporter outer membrane beta-barrel domain-containing protein n=1 Tax=Martelella mediterranea TaxID=293089 RepID=UPI001E54240A|nr:autotransporter outer membrane beta-barrel domain-containing protein [Martelella mediterranea]MCD1633116.1 autotransporter outer membrane beta-barrel domain-containing protein [Martelella mediterranea]
MAIAQHREGSVLALRQQPQTLHRRPFRMVVGAAVTGCLFFQSGAFPVKSGVAHAQSCELNTVSNDGSAIIPAGHNRQQCEVASASEPLSQNDNSPVITDARASVETTSGSVYTVASGQGAPKNDPIYRGAGLGKVISSRASWTNEKSTRTYDWKSNSVFVGGDFAAFSDMRFGALAGYGHSSYRVDEGNARGISDDFTVGVYGGGVFSGFEVDFGAAYTWRDAVSRRDIEFLQLSERIRGRFDGGTFQLFGGISYAFEITDTFQFGPFLDVVYVHQKADAFTETGRFAVLSSLRQTMDAGFTTIGLSGAHEFALGSYESQITSSVGWRHGYGDLDSDTMVAFSGGDPFGVTGTPHAVDHAVFSVGWQTALQDRVSVGITYTGEFGDSARSQNLTALLSVKF